MSKILTGSNAIVKIGGVDISLNSQLIKVDMGPFFSRIYKFTMYNEENFVAENPLKFLHFNNDLSGRLSKRTRKLWQSRTVAVLAASPNFINKTAADFLMAEGKELFIPLVVGVTYLSKDDQYCRATGREQAVNKMKEIDVKVTSVNINETHVFINLAAVEGISLSLRLNRKTGFSTVTGALIGAL